MPATARAINSHNEWDPLREVIVGTAEHSSAVLTWARPEPLRPEVADEAARLTASAYPEWFLAEVAEDLDALCGVFTRLGVTVRRPSPYKFSRWHSTPFWASTGNNCYNARDLHLIVGNTVIESPSPLRGRYFETAAFYPIWYDYLERGFTWISAPKPRLDYDALVPYFADEAHRVLTDLDVKHQQLTGGRIEKLHKLSENEILFEAANTLRLGRDLLYLVSSSGNRLGATWLQSVLGSGYRVHTTDSIYRSSHIDSTVFALRPGLVLLNDARVGSDNCPPLFAKWDKRYFGEVAPVTEAELTFQRDVRDPAAAQLRALGFETTLNEMSSPWVGMNFLSVDPTTVIVDERQVALIRFLEQQALTVIPVRMRHMYTLGGGIHCATLDTVRDGALESYFD
jgi:N-dimethylarginine dimethylaminohydrolase